MCVQDKVQAARALVAKLRSVHGPLVRSTERLCEAYIELAYHDSSVDRPKGTQGETVGYECTVHHDCTYSKYTHRYCT